MSKLAWKLTMLAVFLSISAGCGAGRSPSVRSPPEAARAERGMASWYGKKYQGRPTASGERFDMHEISAAHRTLPFGTVVEVTNLDNGRSVEVRINDRGPFVEGRIIDVSYAAAKKLGMIEAGVVPVKLEVRGSR